MKEAAFDKVQVPRKNIWEALNKLEVTEKVKRVVKSLKSKHRGFVRLNDQKSEDSILKRISSRLIAKVLLSHT